MTKCRDDFRSKFHTAIKATLVGATDAQKLRFFDSEIKLIDVLGMLKMLVNDSYIDKK